MSKRIKYRELSDGLKVSVAFFDTPQGPIKLLVDSNAKMLRVVDATNGSVLKELGTYNGPHDMSKKARQGLKDSGALLLDKETRQRGQKEESKV